MPGLSNRLGSHAPEERTHRPEAACDRTRGGPTAPPQGLCLMEVRYDLGGGNGHDAEIAGDEE